MKKNIKPSKEMNQIKVSNGKATGFIGADRK
jgi:hypothetical protein